MSTAAEFIGRSTRAYRQALADRLGDRDGVTTGGGRRPARTPPRRRRHGPDRLVYPTWQFHTTVLTHLPSVLAAAGFDHDRPVTGWTIAAWLTTPDDALDGMTPRQMLRAGQVDGVLAAAAVVAESVGTDERRRLRRTRTDAA